VNDSEFGSKLVFINKATAVLENLRKEEERPPLIWLRWLQLATWRLGHYFH